MFFSYEGLVGGGTFMLDDTTKGTISADPKQIIGKVVTVTGDGEVGYGSADDEILGVVTQVEYVSTNDDNFVVTVEWGKTFEGIPCQGTESAGEFLAGNGDGTVKTSVEHTGCKALLVDKTNGNTCVIKI